MPTVFDMLVRCLSVSSGSAVLSVLLVVGVLPTVMAQDSSVSVQDGEQEAERSAILVDDFEAYEEGSFPEEWVFVTSDKKIRTHEEVRDPGEEVVVVEEEGNRFVRLITEGEALRYTKRNGEDFDWNLQTHPRIKWRWRAHRLPGGASEKGKNDTGGAIYVTFGTDWLGRPKSIKYTYSSSLPVGTVVSFGPLRVIVVDSANEPRFGEWKTMQRNVIDDYRQVFGGNPPDRPVSVTIWSDSDTTGDEAMVDIDDIEILEPLRQQETP